MRPAMTGLGVGAGDFETLGRLLRCLIKKPIERHGEQGAGPPECDRANRVLLVSPLGAVSRDNSSCPPPSSCCQSKAGGAFG